MAIAVLLAGVHVAWWWFVVSGIRAGLDTLTDRRLDRIWDMRLGPISASGWPASATVRVDTVSVATLAAVTAHTIGVGGTRLTSLTWGSNAVLVRASLARPNQLDVTPIGSLPLRAVFGEPIAVSAETWRLHLTLRLNEPPAEGTFDVGDVLIESGAERFRIGQFHLRAGEAATDGHPSIAFDGSARSIGIMGPNATAIDTATVSGAFDGDWPSDPAGPTAAARRWRDAGGAVRLRQLAFRWGTVRLEAEADLTLDKDLQPSGRGTATLTDYAAAFDALASRGVLTRSAAKAVTALLSLMAKTPPDGSKPSVKLPLTLRSGIISVAGVPLPRLPEIDWPRR